MEQRIYHGNFSSNDFARAIIGEFNRGNYKTQQFSSDQGIIIQIATRENIDSGGKTAISVTFRSVTDGVSVEIGKQSWLSLAASLGQSAFWAFKNPWHLLDRLDDIAQDIESLQLTEDLWRVIERAARALGATFELSERLRRVVCEYCWSANPVGEAACLACGAPLGLVHPRACPNCGFLLGRIDSVCGNCGARV